MGNRITADCGLTIGLDLGDRFTEGRVLDEAGEVVVAFGSIPQEPNPFRRNGSPHKFGALRGASWSALRASRNGSGALR